jgi:hypothetical protein
MLADKLPTRCAASRRAPATTRSMPFCGATRAAFSALHDSGGGQHDVLLSNVPRLGHPVLSQRVRPV